MEVPSTEMINTFQAYRGLSKEMLSDCITLEILLNGDQQEEEQRSIISCMAEDNEAMPNSPLSLDMEQVRSPGVS